MERTFGTVCYSSLTIFNSDRRYYEKLQDAGTYLEEVAEDTAQPEVKTVEQFWDSIENAVLYQELHQLDKPTLQALLMRTQGFSITEILDSIENAVLYQELHQLDKPTLQALLMRTQGFSITEISVELSLNKEVIYKRLNRFKKKIKKLLG